MIVLDAILINAAFYLAYLVRYELQWFRGVEEAFFVPFSNYIPSAAILTGILFSRRALCPPPRAALV